MFLVGVDKRFWTEFWGFHGGDVLSWGLLDCDTSQPLRPWLDSKLNGSKHSQNEMCS
jgi:hypothetical protein